MTWKYPHLLWLAVLVVSAGGLYAALLRRRLARLAVRFPTQTLGTAIVSSRGRRRHAAGAVFASGALLAMVAAAGPVMPWPAPTGLPVVLIIDVSRSMEETDIVPSRIEAARVAATDFARRLPSASRLALVTFGNYATVVAPLTAERSSVIAAIAQLRTQLRTQLGTGLVEDVRAVTGEGLSSSMGPASGGEVRAVAVLLSDGRASDGIPPEDAAREARAQGVRVHTVGLGTAADPSTFRSGYFGVLDEPTLRMIADTTGGRYYKADEAHLLRRVYRDLAQQIGWERRPTEVSAVGAVLAFILLVTAFVLRTSAAPLG